MITLTWIIAIITVLVIVTGLVTTIVVKMKPIPHGGKIGKIIYWIIGILLFKLLLWGIYCHYRDSPVVTPKTTVSTEIPKEERQRGDWYWVLPPGEYIHGRNESASDERTVDIIPQRDGSIQAELHYMEYGQPETQRIRLYKISDKSWKGSADQDNPEEHAKLDMIEVSPGVYAGEIRWSESIKGKCYLTIKK